MKLYQKLAHLAQARVNCEKSGNIEWYDNHTERAEALVKEHMPSGAGWDCGTQLAWYASTPEKLVFCGSYHHMNDAGMYDGWTEHTIFVTPSLANGFSLRISGQNRNDIKEVIHQWFYDALSVEIEDNVVKPTFDRGMDLNDMLGTDNERKHQGNDKT